MMPKVTGANAGWRIQFNFAVHPTNFVTSPLH
jgi:hypothetical protein